MEELLASYSKKPVNLSRGEKIEGEIVAITESEVIVEVGAKSEGILNKKEFSSDMLQELKVGDKVMTFVVSGEDESGQVILSLQPPVRQGYKQTPSSNRWQRFSRALQQKTSLTGRVMEINKGGLVVEADGIRGFLPVSQVCLKDLLGTGKSKGLEGLIGEELTLSVIEVDPNNNKLIFSTRKQLSEEERQKLGKYEVGQEVSGKVVAAAAFGMVLDLDGVDPDSIGVEGVIYHQEVSWDGTVDAESTYKVGQEVKAQVINLDENLGRVNLSLKRLTEDPFETIASEFEVDDVVKGSVTEVSSNGVMVKLRNNIEGFITPSKIEQGTSYNVGQETNFLVDSIDKAKRRINLAPFLTSTKGLLYK